MSEPITILSPTTSRLGRLVRVYGGPVWFRLPGQAYRAIGDVARITADRGGYRVTVDGGPWVAILPAVQRKGARAAATIAGQHFGDRVTLAAVDDVLNYTVERSADCRVDADGWTLAESDGVRLGMYLGDWQRTFGTRMTRTADAVALDVSPERAAALSGTGPAELELDPDVVAGNYSGFFYNADIPAPWSNRVNIYTSGNFAPNQIRCYAYPGFTCARGVLRHDCSTVSGVVTAASIWLRMVGTPAGNRNLHCYAATFSGVVDATRYTPTLNNYRDFVNTTGKVAGDWVTVPVEPVDVTVGGNTDFSLRAADDVTDDTPTVNTDLRFYGPADGASAPYLAITLAAGTAAILSAVSLMGGG